MEANKSLWIFGAVCAALLAVVLVVVLSVTGDSGDSGASARSAGGDAPRTGGGSGDELTSSSSIGLGPTTTSSQRLCDALRTAVNDSTFDAPLLAPEVIDYKPGRSSSHYLAQCKLITGDVQTSSHSSGGGTFQYGAAELTLSNPYLKNGKPGFQPSSYFISNAKNICKGEDNQQLGTAAATVWCNHADTAQGYTRVYFTDLVLTFEMQAPLLLTRNLTFDKFLAARTTVFDALAG